MYTFIWVELTFSRGPNIISEAQKVTSLPSFVHCLEALCAVQATNLVMVVVLCYVYSGNVIPQWTQQN